MKGGAGQGSENAPDDSGFMSENEEGHQRIVNESSLDSEMLL